MTEEITTAIQEQNQGIQEISKAIGLLDQTTHQNSATSKATARNSESLMEQARSIKVAIELLQSMIEDNHNDNYSSETPKLVSVKFDKKAAPSTTQSGRKSASKVVSIVHHQATPLKRASGSTEIPTENDPRFEDV